MKELLEVIAKNLVEHPEQVQVSEKEGERAWILDCLLYTSPSPRDTR